MTENSSSLIVIGTIIAMSAIQIGLIITFVSQIWAKIDRIVNFFMDQRNQIVREINELRREFFHIHMEDRNDIS